MQEINTITYGGVNCYLVKTGDSFMLVDTGDAGHRAAVDRDLESAGCEPGNFKLIVLTHGDSDHCGSAVYLREKYHARIMMHRDEVPAVEMGDMLANRIRKPPLARLAFLFFRLKKADRFKPNITVRDGDTLSGYKLNAQIVHLPGHSIGSIGVLTVVGDLFCGDLLTNLRKPALNALMDDKTAAAASLARLRKLPINKVYPGHGTPFEMAELLGEKA